MGTSPTPPRQRDSWTSGIVGRTTIPPQQGLFNAAKIREQPPLVLNQWRGVGGSRAPSRCIFD
jgi:hypothetical protein